jgi:pimeloyl-ACP methyl ester carboxylesterase
VLDELGIEHFDAIGLSWGGLLAQQLALTSPTSLRRLVLASTNMGLLSVPGDLRAIRTLLTPRRYQSVTQLRLAAAAFGGQAHESMDPRHPPAAARLQRPPTLRGYYTQIAALAGWTSLPWLPLLRQQTLVLCGEHDPAVPLVNARILARLIPHAELRIFPNAGHLLYFDDASTPAHEVAAFLRRP